jgi:hypothetical protein
MECTECGERHLVLHSWRNRACARCGGERARDWVERQRDQLLPVPCFHVVFTVPAELRALVRKHQKELIGVLFRAAFESLAALCADPRYLGGDIGARHPIRIRAASTTLAFAEPQSDTDRAQEGQQPPQLRLPLLLAL